MQITMCRPTVNRTFNPESEEDIQALKQFYKDKYNNLWNEREKIEARIGIAKLNIELIDKGKINEAMIKEYVGN